MAADLSPPSPPSPRHSDDDDDQDDRGHHGGARSRRRSPGGGGGSGRSSPGGPLSPGGAASASAAASSHAKERRLIELLSKAAQEIRVERSKVKQLMDENASLRDEIKAYRSKKAAAERQQTNSVLSKEVLDLRRQIADIMTIHKATVSELEQSKEQMRTMQSRLREQQRVLQQTSPKPAQGGRSSSPNGGAYAERHGGRSASSGARGVAPNDAPLRGRPTGATQAASRGSSATPQPRPASPVKRSHSGTGGHYDSGSHHHSNKVSPGHFDAMESIHLIRQHSRSPPRQQHGSRVVMVTSPRHVDPVTTAPQRDTEQLGALRQAAQAANAELQYNDTMLSRMRRAIAPPPTKEQIAEVVHAMVVELVRSAARNGLKLEMKRVAPCQYECGKRKLTLTVDSRRLVVKCGGGHVDMNEYAQRHHLWTSMPTAA